MLADEYVLILPFVIICSLSIELNERQIKQKPGFIIPYGREGLPGIAL